MWFANNKNTGVDGAPAVFDWLVAVLRKPLATLTLLDLLGVLGLIWVVPVIIRLVLHAVFRWLEARSRARLNAVLVKLGRKPIEYDQ